MAPYYYYPGWWEGTGMGTAYINMKAWQSLPPIYQKAIEVAANEVTLLDAGEVRRRQPGCAAPTGGGRHQAAAVPDRRCSRPATTRRSETCAEISAKNPKFKKVYDHWKPYRAEQILWSRVAEGGFDNFMARMHGAGKV